MKQAGSIILAICTVAVFIIGLLNGASTPFSLVGMSWSVPSGALLIVGYMLGFVSTLSLLISRMAAGSANHQRLSQWQHQDEKLMQEVQTDREKQLEAKIQTLETALQRALGKRSS